MDVSLITFYILRKKWVSNYIVIIVYVKNGCLFNYILNS